MIGVLSKPDQRAAVEEFFELFKTPWEFWRDGRRYDAVIVTSERTPQVDARLLVVYGAGDTTAAGMTADHTGGVLRWHGTLVPIYGRVGTFKTTESGNDVQLTTAAGDAAAVRADDVTHRQVRVGFDLFNEVQYLMTAGQPVTNAPIPTLDVHIAILREWLLDAGVALTEILPAPAGHRFAVCLTHDIDFIGVRQHKFDHSMWGFVHRSTIGGLTKLMRGRISVRRYVSMLRAVLLLPFVYLGWAKDFWEPFDWYRRVERSLAATYFLIPYKGRAGEDVPGRRGARRATAYDVTDLSQSVAVLTQEGYEIGVHGIDAWHSTERGREERARVAAITGATEVGIRMHWLLRDSQTMRVLEEAGYSYDSTAGYNETIGYRNGTGQVFRPFGAHSLLELPLHIQDGALFYPGQLNLTEPEAERRCQELVANAERFGGVVTVLWHDRSHGPERFWGDFYMTLVRTLQSSAAWFGTAAQIVGWFRKRRDVRFVATQDGKGHTLRYEGAEIDPPVVVRSYKPRSGAGSAMRDAVPAFVDLPWNGKAPVPLEELCV